MCNLDLNLTETSNLLLSESCLKFCTIDFSVASGRRLLLPNHLTYQNETFIN